MPLYYDLISYAFAVMYFSILKIVTPRNKTNTTVALNVNMKRAKTAKQKEEKLVAINSSTV